MNTTRFPILFALAILSASAAEGPAQESALPSAQFTAYHKTVDKAFDEMLRNLEPPAPRVATAAIAEVPHTVEQSAPPRFELPLEEAIEDFAARFWNGRTDQLNAALWRMNRIRPALERTLAEEGVPLRFAAIVLVESAASAAALSPKSAGGLWQLIPDTARRYGLVVSGRRDDRIDLQRATRAAARYLRDLHRMFGDWRLALAAYNAGEGTIQSALNRAHSPNFQALSDRRLIPEETRNYVPAVLAAINLLALGAETEEAFLRPQP